jgi:hypothetical protein
METTRWDVDRAWAWYRGRPWLCGFNYVPSTAINPIELWAAETFDPATIDRELGWAGAIGFNTLRVNLHSFAWEADSVGLLERIDRFLGIARRHGLSSMFCLFDDCAHSGKQPYHGKQDEPVPGVHNSGWTPSPAHAQAQDRAYWPTLERYVKGVVGRFADDPRVLLWDLYNEPSNSGTGDKSVPLLNACFDWARAAAPKQPLSSGVWTADFAAPTPGGVTEAMLELSDVTTFHNYGEAASVEAEIDALAKHGRPVICTEWMRRTGNSRFETHLPIFQKRSAGCYFWGLVNGRSQTNFPWGSPKGAPEPALWFHDLLRRDGTPYLPDEVDLIRKLLGR